MTGRGRSRGRGRGRGNQDGGHPPGRFAGDNSRGGYEPRQPGPRSSEPRPNQGQGPPRASAWNTPRQPPPQSQQYQMPAPLQVQQRHAAPAEQSKHPEVMAPKAGGDSSASSVPPGMGRAAFRGGATQAQPGVDKLSSEFSKLSFRRMRDENVHSRPENIAVSDKPGTSGRTLNLYCNYFDILTMPAYSLHHYHVNFAPEVEGKRVRKALLEQHANKYFGPIFLFDGMMLFLPKKLPDTLELVSRSDMTDTVYNITITWRCKVMRTSPIIIQLLNILYKKILVSLNLVQIGRNYYSVPKQFDQDSKLAKVHRLSILDGIQSSILNYERGAMLCVDISHKVMRLDTVADIMMSCKMKINSPGWKEAILRRLLGRVVLTRYNNRTYRIDDIDMNMLPTRTFLRHNTPISFVEYYKTNYGVIIRHTNLPMLLSKPKARDIRRGQNTPIYLVPELVTITGLEDEVRTNFDIMRDLAQSTRLTPDTRIDRLEKFIQRTRQNPEVAKLVSQWEMQLSDKLAKVPARVLEPERIIFGDSKILKGEENAEWSGPMRGLPLHTSRNVSNWLLIYPRTYSRMAGDFEECLKRVADPLRIKYQEPIWCETRDMDPSGQAYIACIKENVVDTTQLVVALVHDNAKSRYDAIKKFCSIDQPAGRPIPSQVVVQRSLTKKNTFMSVATKIAIQINCKLGGTPWLVQLPLNNFMIVGIDHYHDSAKKGHSVGGIVASMNKDLTHWYSRTTFQTAHEELSSKMHIVMQMLLKRYVEVNKCLPERVFIYRDGVGDGQLNVLVTYELKQYEEAFRTMAPDHKFKMACIVVKKRINTRLFMENFDRGQTVRRGPNTFRDNSKWKNPLPGTVVDKDIVRNEWYDFFVISQSVRQGTVSPTHYNVIYDKSALKPDHLQKLTYKMCHLYYNWPGTIRVPAPCQYAHKLAFLVGQSIHREPAMALRDKLFYL